MMNKYLVNKGDLRNRSILKNTLPSLILSAASDPTEIWSNIEVVTLKQHTKDIISEAVWEHSELSSIPDIEHEIERQLNASQSVKEFVSFQHDKILIAVDASVVDDNTIDKALIMLMNVKTFEPGSIQYFE